MNSVFTILIFVALPLCSVASGDDHDDKEICGELELEAKVAVKDQHKDEHIVEGIQEGLATYLGISKTYVKIKFDGAAVDHSGHGHRRLAAVDHLVADYNITFPSSAADSTVTAASDLLKATKASTNKTSSLIESIKAKVKSSIAEAAAAGETLTVEIVGGELLNNPSIGHTCHTKAAEQPTSSSFGLSCFLGSAVLLMPAML